MCVPVAECFSIALLRRGRWLDSNRAHQFTQQELFMEKDRKTYDYVGYLRYLLLYCTASPLLKTTLKFYIRIYNFQCKDGERYFITIEKKQLEGHNLKSSSKNMSELELHEWLFDLAGSIELKPGIIKENGNCRAELLEIDLPEDLKEDILLEGLCSEL